MKREEDLGQFDALVVDGDNLLHHIRGSRDEGGVAWLLPRLSAWRPEHLRIIVTLDGHAPRGEPARRRATRGIEFQHSGSRSADDLIIEMLAAQPYAARSRTAVVSGDRGLQARARRAGGITRSVAWLTDQLAADGRGSAHGQGTGTAVRIGQGRRAGGSPPRREESDVDERGGWQPGRGATRKQGNPRRSPKRERRR